MNKAIRIIQNDAAFLWFVYRQSWYWFPFLNDKYKLLIPADIDNMAFVAASSLILFWCVMALRVYYRTIIPQKLNYFKRGGELSHPSLCICVRFGYWVWLLITGFPWTVAVNSTAECHKAKTVDGVQSTPIFWSGTTAVSIACGNKKVQEPERKWVGGKKSKREKFPEA